MFNFLVVIFLIKMPTAHYNVKCILQILTFLSLVDVCWLANEEAAKVNDGKPGRVR